MTDAAKVTESEWATWRTFMRMRGQLDLALERELQRTAEISVSEYGILISLFEAPDRQLRAGELGQRLSWEKSRVSHQVSRMEKRGLVERRLCDSDARGTWVGLTPAGSRVVLGAMRDHSASLRRFFFDALGPGELDVLLAASERIVAATEPDAARW
jgi:DNA-binding MarR family transcriptional regulator